MKTNFSTLPVLGAAMFLVVSAGGGAGLGRLQPPSAQREVLVVAGDVFTLRNRVEALRSDLLSQPSIRAVKVEGLRQQSLAVEFTPASLARASVSEESLRAALPVDPVHSRPGHLSIRPDAESYGIKEIADLPVRTGRATVRLGDVALVVRGTLETPVTTMSRNGLPAARVVVLR